MGNRVELQRPGDSDCGRHPRNLWSPSPAGGATWRGALVPEGNSPEQIRGQTDSMIGQYVMLGKFMRRRKGRNYSTKQWTGCGLQVTCFFSRRPS